MSITKQPTSVEVESDYTESYMEVAYEQSMKQGYTITPQWYMQQNGKKTKVVMAIQSSVKFLPAIKQENTLSGAN